MFKVYDIDDKNAGLDKQDFIGHAVQLSTRARARARTIAHPWSLQSQECRLSELMTSSGQTLVLTLVYGTTLPIIIANSTTHPRASAHVWLVFPLLFQERAKAEPKERKDLGHGRRDQRHHPTGPNRGTPPPTTKIRRWVSRNSSLLKLTCSTRHADAERQGQIRQDEKGVSPVQVLCAQS
jgi:hypothetical protein